jgi:hypothetical protein
LVRAWRAGFAVIMLDGFDEIATAGWAGRTKKLNDLRYRSMELVRAFLRETPGDSGIAVAGRDHFFDSIEEMNKALGLDSKFTRVTLAELTVTQVAEYLRRKGWDAAVPAWLPTRPLLISYLASRGLLRQTLEIEAGSAPAAGWHHLIDRICAREAEIEPGLDAETIRHLIERIGTQARASVDGLGPLSSEQIRDAFVAICGYPPDDRGMVLLQRLPGLGVHSAEDSSRRFIDQDIAASLQAGDIYSFVTDPYSTHLDSADWQSTLPRLGVDVAAYRTTLANHGAGKLSTAVREAAAVEKQGMLAADVISVIAARNLPFQGAQVFIPEVLASDFDLSETSSDLTAIEYQNCIFGTLTLPSTGESATLPTFRDCHIEQLVGRSGSADVEWNHFPGSRVEGYDTSSATTNAIMDMKLPLGVRVLLSVLKKLYAQRGTGRKEGAFSRGLDHAAQRFVPEVLDLLRREGFALPTKIGGQSVWLPVRDGDTRERALRMLAAPHASNDALLSLSAALI